jgi:hypothetical protein
VKIGRVDFLGWKDAYRISNGAFAAIVVPQVARIMSYGPVGGQNMLWVDDKLTPERGAKAAPLSPTQWQNYGGYKLWPAPENKWGGPVDWQLDRGPCRVEVGAGSLRLVGMSSVRHGIRFDRQITLAPEGSDLEIVQTAVNVSDKEVTTSIWDVTQVKADCVGFVPLGPGASFRSGAGRPPDGQWRRVGDMLLLKPSGKDGKLFISGPPGWLGCKRGALIYLKSFEIAATPPTEPETPREVYTSRDLDYIELEVVGPAATLKPGDATTLKETWRLLPAGPETATDEGLIKAVHDKAQVLGLQ